MPTFLEARRFPTYYDGQTAAVLNDSVTLTLFVNGM